MDRLTISNGKQSMMTVIRFAMVTATVLVIFMPNSTNACPHCNIHNYLAESVQSSTNIFLGKVIRQLDDKTAEVSVLKVLRGQYTNGTSVRVKMYSAKDHVANRFIFSDPVDNMEPTFEVLPTALEDEIVFLTQAKPAAGSVKDAIRRVQGVSVMTQKIGMDYLTNHYDSAAGPLVSELKGLMPEVFSSNEVFFGEHRAGMLLEALLSRESDTARRFAVAYIENLAEPTPDAITWTSIPYYASSRGVFLKDILRHSRKCTSLASCLHERAFAVLPKLRGKALADTTYAIVTSGTDTPDAVLKVVRGNDSTNMVALGLFFAGNFASSWWQHDDAYTFWDKGLSLAKQKELKAAITERITDAERLWKRGHKDAKSSLEDYAQIKRLLYECLLSKLSSDDWSTGRLVSAKNNTDANIIAGVIKNRQYSLRYVKYETLKNVQGVYQASENQTVAIVSITELLDQQWNIEYQCGPEGGAAKRVKVQNLQSKWQLVGTDDKWDIF